MATGKNHYIAVIGDIVGSRRLGAKERLGTQGQLRKLVGRLNGLGAQRVAAEFTITTGDEFQGLLKDAGAVLDVLSEAERTMAQVTLRLGIGMGTLSLPLRRIALDVDGPAFHSARTALEDLESGARGGARFRGFTMEGDRILDGIAALLLLLWRRRTSHQRRLSEALSKYETGVEVARRLRVTPQAVSKAKAGSGFEAGKAGGDALRLSAIHFFNVSRAANEENA